MSTNEKSYWIRMNNLESGAEGYSFNKFAFPKQIALNIVKSMRVIHPSVAWTLVPEGNETGLGEPQKKDYEPPTILFSEVELQLSAHDTNFSRKFGRKVKLVGGSYSACRGSCDCRFVHLPTSSWELICEILCYEIERRVQAGVKSDVQVCMIARKFELPGYEGTTPSWVIVHYWRRAIQERQTNQVSPMHYLVSKVWESVGQAISNRIIRPAKPAEIVIAPTTPVTAKDSAEWALSKINRAIEYFQAANIHHTPLWSSLQDTKMDIQRTIDKLS